MASVGRTGVSSVGQFASDVGNEFETPNDSEVYPIHSAVWNNDLGALDVLVEAGVHLDICDGESGWTSLQRALYFGRVRAGARLLAAGASLSVKDPNGRSSIDLVSKELMPLRKKKRNSSKKTEVFSWGSGANYQLGTGSTDLTTVPRRLATLGVVHVKSLSASKFHTVALTEGGVVYTWGWSRGGRLGHADFNWHGREGAQIYPRAVEGLTGKVVVSVAAAKHHTLAVTSLGEVYSWGSNKDGKLGYQAVDTQPIPKKIAFLKGVFAEVAAAANRHSAIITIGGGVYTWGANDRGQLGYGTSDSASNPTPRPVESIQERFVTDLSLSKHHSIVATKDGEVFSWGNKHVNPRKLSLHSAKGFNQSLSGDPIHFHRGIEEVNRPFVVAVAAGGVHSSCVTRTGAVFTWRSSDPELRFVPVGGELAGRKAVSVGAGKTVTAVVGELGEVYTWEGNPLESRSHNRDGRNTSPISVDPERVEGLNSVVEVWVGEKHTVALQEWESADVKMDELATCLKESRTEEASSNSGSAEGSQKSELLVIPDDSLCTDDMVGSFGCLADVADEGVPSAKSLPSLQDICEKAVAREVLEPRNAIQILEYAYSIDANVLKRCCLEVVVFNLDVVLMEAAEVLAWAQPHVVSDIEAYYQQRVLHRDKLPHDPWWLEGSGNGETVSGFGMRPTLVLGEGENEAGFSVGSVGQRLQGFTGPQSWGALRANTCGLRFMPDRTPTEEEVAAKLKRNVKKKLQQIANLEAKGLEGVALDEQQLSKIGRKKLLEQGLHSLECGSSAATVQVMLQCDLEQEDVSRSFGGSSSVPKQFGTPRSNKQTVDTTKKRRKKSKGASVVSDVIAESNKTAVELTPVGSKEEENQGEVSVCSMGFSVPSEPSTQTTIEVKQRKQRGKGKKGGLSAFLSGKLEQPEPVERVPSHDGPAWGKVLGSNVKTHPGASLVNIMQQERSSSSTAQPSQTLKSMGCSKTTMGPSSWESGGGGGKRMSLADFMTKPVTVKKKSGLAWGGAGQVPSPSPKQSLQDIQFEQETRKLKGWAPLSKGKNVSGGGGSAAASRPVPPPSRWYVPEGTESMVHPIPAIQIEEKAVQELTKLYGDAEVKVVQGSASGSYHQEEKSIERRGQLKEKSREKQKPRKSIGKQ